MDSFLNILSVLIPFVLSVLGAIMSTIETKPKLKKWIWILFLSVGIAGSAVTYWQQSSERISHDNEVKGFKESLSALQIQLQVNEVRSASDLSYLKGQLDTFIKIGSKQFTQLEKIDTSITEAIKKKTEQFTNEQLSNAAISLAEKMRNFEMQNQQERTDREKKWRILPKATKEEETKRFQERLAEEDKYMAKYVAEFKNRFLGEAVYLKDELLKRLPQEPKPKQFQVVAFDGYLVGPYPVSEAANYLELLARKLSPTLTQNK